MTTAGRIDVLHLLDPPPEGWRRLTLVGAPGALVEAAAASGLAEVVVAHDVAEALARPELLRDGPEPPSPGPGPGLRADASAGDGDAGPIGPIDDGAGVVSTVDDSAGGAAATAGPEATLDAALVFAPPEAGRRRRLLSILASSLGQDVTVAVASSAAWRPQTTLAAVARDVAGAGLQIRGRWLALPSFPAPRRFVPVDGADAMAWYLSSMLDAVAARRPLAALARRRRFGGAVAAVAGAVASHGVVVAGPSSSGPSPHRLLTTSGSDDHSRTVVVHLDDGSSPRLVDKVATSPAGNATIVAEHARMAEVRNTLDAEAVGAIPQPLGLRAVGRLVAGTETARSGRSLSVLAPGDETGDAMGAAARWLRFLATGGIDRWDRPAWERWIAAPADAVTADHAASAQALADGVAPLADGTLALPMAIRHHDYGPWNLLWGRDGLAVLDWEWGPSPPDPHGPALADLVYLATYWVHAAGGHHDAGAQADVLAELWCEPVPARPEVRTARRVVRGELRAAGVADAAVPLLVAHTWLDQAATVTARRAVAGTARTDAPHPWLAVDVLAGHLDGLTSTWT